MRLRDGVPVPGRARRFQIQTRRASARVAMELKSIIPCPCAFDILFHRVFETARAAAEETYGDAEFSAEAGGSAAAHCASEPERRAERIRILRARRSAASLNNK